MTTDVATTAAGVGVLLRVARVAIICGALGFGAWSGIPSLLPQVGAALALPNLATALPATTLTPVARPAAGATTMVYSESDLTRLAATYFPATYAGITLSSPSVRVSSGRVVLNATARTFLGTSPLVATTTPYASDGTLALRVDSATVGGVALPETARTQLAQQLQSAIDGQISQRMHVTGVTAAEGTLAIRGTALQ